MTKANFIGQTFMSSSVTSKCPYEQALCRGTRPLNTKVNIEMSKYVYIEQLDRSYI